MTVIGDALVQGGGVDILMHDSPELGKRGELPAEIVYAYMIQEH